jgi:hypothetical protein
VLPCSQQPTLYQLSVTQFAPSYSVCQHPPTHVSPKLHIFFRFSDHMLHAREGLFGLKWLIKTQIKLLPLQSTCTIPLCKMSHLAVRDVLFPFVLHPHRHARHQECLYESTVSIPQVSTNYLGLPLFHRNMLYFCLKQALHKGITRLQHFFTATDYIFGYL